MKFQRLGVVLLGFFIIVGCTDKEVPIEEQATIDVAQVKADQLLAKDIRWMEEKNTQLYTINDSQIVTYDTFEPIGPYVQYEADDVNFDSDRHPLYVSFHGKQYRFELGWTGPNLHTLAYRFSERESPLQCDSTPFRGGMRVRSNTEYHE